MHAIINQKDGSHYVSAVFGYYKKISATDDYQRYMEGIHNPYYVVWDATYTKLVKHLVMVPNTKYMIPQVLIVDCNQNDWKMNDDGEGCVSFLDKSLIDTLVDAGELPADVMQKCKSAYSSFVYDDTPEIMNQHDIDNLMWASGGFHDATLLKNAVSAFNAERNEPNFLDVLEFLRDSYVWIPCNAILSDADEAKIKAMVEGASDNLDSLVGLEMSNEDAIRLVPDILQNGDNFFFPVFSSVEEMGEYGEHFSKVEKHMLEAIAMARNNDKKVSGIVLNAFTEPFILEAEIFDIVEKMKTRL